MDHEELLPSPTERKLLQGVQTSLGYAKCNVLKFRKVCERSELRLQSYVRLQTFLTFRILHLAYPKLVGTPCSGERLTFKLFLFLGLMS